MKNVLKTFGTQIRWICAIALVAVMGFSMAACGGGGDDDNNNNNNNNNNNGTVTAASLYGTWDYVGEPYLSSYGNHSIYDSLVFGKNDGQDQFVWDGYKLTDDIAINSGSYSVSGSTLKFVQWDGKDSSSGSVTISANGNTMTLSGFSNWNRLVGTWYKRGAGLSSGAVTLNSVTANGSSTLTTSELVLTFNEKINGLTAADITLSGVAGVTKGTLTGGPRYVLPISGFTAGGTLNVAVAKSGFTISGSPKTVTIYALNWNPAVDVYVAGTSINNTLSRYATYWKNGTPQTLLNSPGSEANSIFVSGSTVYMALTVSTKATVWNSSASSSTQLSSQNSYAESVFVSGSDVYVTGQITGSGARLWKNGVAQTLSSGSGESGTSVFVYGSDVYVVGRGHDGATLWINGEARLLDETGGTNSVFVKARQ